MFKKTFLFIVKQQQQISFLCFWFLCIFYSFLFKNMMMIQTRKHISTCHVTYSLDYNYFRMSVIHCHDDKQFIMLDQDLFLRDIYTQTKDWRKMTTADSFRNLTWRKDLFYVERPFRMTKKTKKNTV